MRIIPMSPNSNRINTSLAYRILIPSNDWVVSRKLKMGFTSQIQNPDSFDFSQERFDFSNEIIHGTTKRNRYAHNSKSQTIINPSIDKDWKKESKGDKDDYKGNDGDDPIKHGEHVEDAVLPGGRVIDYVPPTRGGLEAERRHGLLRRKAKKLRHHISRPANQKRSKGVLGFKIVMIPPTKEEKRETQKIWGPIRLIWKGGGRRKGGEGSVNTWVDVDACSNRRGRFSRVLDFVYQRKALDNLGWIGGQFWHSWWNHGTIEYMSFFLNSF